MNGINETGRPNLSAEKSFARTRAFKQPVSSEFANGIAVSTAEPPQKSFLN